MSKRIVVALSTIFAVRGGIQRFNQMLCLAIDQLAPELSLSGKVISLDDTHEDYARCGSPWSTLELVPGDGQLKLMGRTFRICARERPDLMLIGLLGMTPAGLISLPFLKRGYGFISHGIEVWDESRISRRVAGRRAKFALAVSTHTRQALHESIGFPLDAIHLLPNTLDPGFESMPDEAGSAEAARPELLTVSRLWREETMKGVDHTIEAFARVRKRHPEALYRIVGKGSDKPRLQQLAASLELGDSVIFEEDLTDEELAQRYRRCAAYVMPSGQEGFGIVFLEAMRFSKPCLGGNAGGTPDVIDDGVTGILVPFGDLDVLTSSMERLLSDPDLRRRMGLAGHQRLLDHFVFDRFRERVRDYLVRFLGA
jgi:glycosyltransferase involved in cell wall biosynthesis